MSKPDERTEIWNKDELFVIIVMKVLKVIRIWFV